MLANKKVQNYDLPSFLEFPELITLAKSISCNFVDARTTSKDYVRRLASRHSDSHEGNGGYNQFLLSTCLRYEIYNCSNTPKYIDPFFHVRGLTCIRRLLSVLVGLQSEIVGEREIALQTVQSIYKSRDIGKLDLDISNGLEKLILISEKIREYSGVTSDENYSTIAADLFIEHLSRHPHATIAIVGGGYMADKFFRGLLKAGSLKIKKIFWVNRNTSKIKRELRDLIDLLDFYIEVLDLDAGKNILKEADAIFCALANSSELFGDTRLKETSFTVDVSYPQVFTNQANTKLVTVSNTHFDRLMKEPVPKDRIALANKEIDTVVNFLESRL